MRILPVGCRPLLLVPLGVAFVVFFWAYPTHCPPVTFCFPGTGVPDWVNGVGLAGVVMVAAGIGLWLIYLLFLGARRLLEK